MRFHNYKIFFAVLFVIVSIILFTNTALSFTESEPEILLQQYHSSMSESEKLSYLRSYTGLVIDKRIVSIDSVISQIRSDYRIPENDKEEMLSLLNDARSVLEKYKNDALTASLDDLPILIENIFIGTRVYQVLLPKVYGMRTSARSKNVVEDEVIKYFDGISSYILYKQTLGQDTEDLEETFEKVKNLTDEIIYRTNLAKESLMEMKAGKNLSNERQLLEGAKVELSRTQILLMETQFEMRKLIKMMDSLN